MEKQPIKIEYSSNGKVPCPLFEKCQNALAFPKIFSLNLCCIRGRSFLLLSPETRRKFVEELFSQLIFHCLEVKGTSRFLNRQIFFEFCVVLRRLFRQRLSTSSFENVLRERRTLVDLKGSDRRRTFI